MASVSGIASISTVKPYRRASVLHSVRSTTTVRFALNPDQPRHLSPPKSIARVIPAGLSQVPSIEKKALEKDPGRLWRRYVDWLYQHKELGLFLDVSRIGFTDEFLERMEPKLLKAFRDMEELERGAIANPDEGRMVGHYWLRNSSLAPNPFLKVLIDNTLDAVCKFADDIISGKIKPPSSPAGRFTQILSVGIGGSALGPQFVAEALAPDNPPLKIRFIDNTDPAGIDHQIAQLGEELASTLVVVISKSGGTPETRNGLLEVQKAFREAGLEFSKQGVAITQENSLLDNTARIEGWVARFPMFDWVGGRTSEMSAVGLLPAALQGINVREMLEGAALMDEANRTTVVKNNPAALLALCWYWATDGFGSKDMVVLPYKDSLLLFSRYLQQLVMESLGKEFDLDGNRVNQGITVYGNKGSTDQHAYIQQLREGVHNFFATFIEVLRDRPPGHDWELEPGVTCGDYLFGMLQGTRSALYANDRESITVTLQEVTPRSVGAVVALYERAVGIYASLVNINAYHQPGVEAGKKAAGEVLALQKRILAVLNEASCKEPVEPLTLDEIADRCHCPEDIEMIYKIIAHMAANDRALIAEGSCGSPRSIKISAFRRGFFSGEGGRYGGTGMFTEGLDPNALRWVREGPRIDPLRSARNVNWNYGVTPANKFRTGQVPSRVIPVSGSVGRDEDASVSGSDMDETTDTEEEVYGGRYSLDSSPQEDIIPSIPNGASHRYVAPSARQENFSDSDSAGSSTSGVLSGASYPTESYSSNVPSGVDTKSGREKGDLRRGVLNRNFADSDTPSAPPFQRTRPEISEDSDNVTSSQACGDPKLSSANNYSVKKVQSVPKNVASVVGAQVGHGLSDNSVRTNAADVEVAVPSAAARVPTFHASGQGPWHAVVAYDACVRLCLHSWARGCMEAPVFLENECALLRNSFGLQQILLQSEEELLAKRSSELVSEAAAPKPKKMIGKMKVQVRKVKMSLDMPPGCSFSSLKSPSLKLEPLKHRMTNLHSTLSAGWDALRKIRVLPRTSANASFSRHSLAYVHASTQYIKQVSALLKVGVTTLRSGSSYEIVQESYSCQLRLKSSPEEDSVKMQPGSGETHLFFPDSLSDDLIVEIYDSKGKFCGRVLAQVAAVAEEPGDKLRWWSIYREPEHELVGRLQLYINYTTSQDENSSLKCGSVAETVAYDLVLEVAMKVQHFRQRHLLLHGQWKWLLTEFAAYYGVSDAYTKLRYLSYIMDVATPTADCLILVYDLLSPILLKGRSKSTLSHQENRILGEIEEQINHILAVVFENYKSLDEFSTSGLMDVFRPATGTAAAALVPAIKLYTLLHDILSPEAQLKFCGYFQVAAKKRSRMHMMETDEYVTNSTEGTAWDPITTATAYQKMRALCMNIRNEVFTDIEIHNQHLLPSFIDLPNIAASIYTVELCNRLRTFLVACPPTGPSPPVADLVIATADFQRDLASWNIGGNKEGAKGGVKGGVDAKELFHLYIILWIQDKRLSLLECCKLDKVKWSGVRTQHSTTPFVDEMYDRLNDTLNEYEVIVCRWPEYTFVLENAVVDVEKAVVEALDKQYADVLSPLRDTLTPKKFGFKYVQKLAKRNSVCPYIVPEELGILLNTMKRSLDVLMPRIETQLKSWGSCIPDGGTSGAGEKLSEVTVLLRTKFRNYIQAVVEKLAENTRLQSNTKLKRIIQDSKENVIESDVRSRMQPLREQLTSTIDHLHTVFETHVFVTVCRGFWDRMGQDVLNFLENRKESKSWYKSSRIAVAILDDTFASQMQQLLGNALLEKDLEPPRSIMEVRSVLCKDAPNHKDSNFYY
ncbi:hypothetical protein H6P81_010755 [Aristolochia fimbriata]|uniref:Glucose-6-phosphate isomerase n=1 Tax=Aristolochia fimbriata TaxID=158543 RepID=A0AAV7ERS1_ARIFI|nr:hypothetical protein H6P81_010755 [Aristolochia fimbriata]